MTAVFHHYRHGDFRVLGRSIGREQGMIAKTVRDEIFILDSLVEFDYLGGAGFASKGYLFKAACPGSSSRFVDHGFQPFVDRSQM